MDTANATHFKELFISLKYTKTTAIAVAQICGGGWGKGEVFIYVVYTEAAVAVEVQLTLRNVGFSVTSETLATTT